MLLKVLWLFGAWLSWIELMAALKQSPVALNVQSAPSVRALQNAVNGPRSYRPFKSALISTGLPRSTLIHNALTWRSPRVGGGGHRAVVVMVDTAAASYAAALAEAAQAAHALEAVSNDIDKLSQLILNKELYGFLSNPIVADEKKKSILKAVADDAELQPYTLNFLNILIDRKRFDLIGDIIKEFEVIYNKLTDTELATVTSVVKLESHHLAEIAKKIQSFTSAKNVRLKTIIDPSLVAGFTVRYGPTGSNLIDLSVKTQLDRIAGQLGYKEKIAL